jgi:hypothetical protein
MYIMKNSGEDVEEKELIHCWWECKLVETLWRIVWRFLNKLKVDLCVIQESYFWIYIQKK